MSRDCFFLFVIHVLHQCLTSVISETLDVISTKKHKNSNWVAVKAI